MKKIKIGILFGGKSVEHEVSIISAFSIIRHLDYNKYIGIPIYICTSGKWYLLDTLYSNQNISSIKEEIKKIQNKSSVSKEFNIMNNMHEKDGKLDVVFPVLHGLLGEDGTVQGLFEILEIPYISAGVLSSAIAMDKAITKKLVQQCGINVTPFVEIKEHEYNNEVLNKVLGKFHFPLFVKPSNSGSSVGINKTNNVAELEKAILEAFKYDQKILIEQGIIGREIEVSVLENIDNDNEPIVSYPGELIPNDEFYTYKAKYIMEEGAKFEIPAQLPVDVENMIRKNAKDIFRVLECSCLARVDFLIENKTKQVLFSEINTLPGFTEISLYPKLLEHYGIGYTKLLDKLIGLAIKKYKVKQGKVNNSIKVLQDLCKSNL